MLPAAAWSLLNTWMHTPCTIAADCEQRYFRSCFRHALPYLCVWMCHPRTLPALPFLGLCLNRWPKFDPTQTVEEKLSHKQMR